MKTNSLVTYKLFFSGMLTIGLCIHSNKNIAQNLVSDFKTGYDSTSSSSFMDVNGAEAKINITNTNAVLVISTFESFMFAPNESYRDASYRIVDNTNPELINSGDFTQSLSHQKSNDNEIGSIVYIFNTAGYTGNKTYQLQHAFDNPSRKLYSKVNIAAIALSINNKQLPYAIKTINSPVETTNSWTPIPGTETSSINTSNNGGFYVSATIQCKTPNFNKTALGQWKLQYKVGTNGIWTDFGKISERTMSKTAEIGNVSLVASLPDTSSYGQYYFRIAHKNMSPTSNIVTEKANIVAVALSTDSEIFQISNSSIDEASTSSSQFSNITGTSISPINATDYFIHAQFNILSNSEINTAKYDLFVNNNKYDGIDQNRFVSGNFENGSGSSIGLIKNLLPNTTYNITLRHASTNNNTLLSRHISLNGFDLRPTYTGPLPINLLFFNTYCAMDSGVILKWATSAEVNNDYFTLYRSEDGINWKETAKINGNGNSNQINNYEYKDFKSTTVNTYYKLKQTDFDGTSKEYDIVTIFCKYECQNTKVYFNSTGEFLLINFSKKINNNKPLIIKIYNSNGQIIDSQTLGSNLNNPIQITLPNKMKKGIYFIHAIQNNEYLYTGQIEYKF